MSENNIKPNDIETLFGKSIQELTVETMDGKTESVSINFQSRFIQSCWKFLMTKLQWQVNMQANQRNG